MVSLMAPFYQGRLLIWVSSSRSDVAAPISAPTVVQIEKKVDTENLLLATFHAHCSNRSFKNSHYFRIQMDSDSIEIVAFVAKASNVAGTIFFLHRVVPARVTKRWLSKLKKSEVRTNRS